MLCKATVTHEGLIWSSQQPGASLVGLPATDRAASSRTSTALGTTILRETPSDFTSIKKRLFNISSLSLGLRLKFLRNSDLFLHPAGWCRATALLAQQAALESFPC